MHRGFEVVQIEAVRILIHPHVDLPNGMIRLRQEPLQGAARGLLPFGWNAVFEVDEGSVGLRHKRPFAQIEIVGW